MLEKVIENWTSRCDYIRACRGSPMPEVIIKILHAEIVEVEIEIVSPSIVPSGNFAELNRTVTCMVLKANDRRTSCPCHDVFRGPRSDYVRQTQVELGIKKEPAEWAISVLLFMPGKSLWNLLCLK
ncbi:hypothetical protein TNCV_2274661 [Trichonephila clavipes]|nr:hypothetical protein TNCV_2274661 [Trichonephila clavipes]